MNQDLATRLFEEAKKRHDRQSTLLAIGLAAAAFFHLVHFSQYLDLRGQSLGQRRDQQRLERSATALTAIGREFDRIEKGIADFHDQRLEPAVTSLVGNFERLQAKIDAARRGDPDPDSFDTGAMTAQSQAPQKRRLPPFDEELRTALQEKKVEPEALRERLKSYVQDFLIDPELEELNARLRQELAPTVQAAAARTQELVKGLQPEVAGLSAAVLPSADLVKGIAESVAKLADAAKSLELTVPKDEPWWARVDLKTTTLEHALDHAVQAKRGRLDTTALAELETRVADASRRQQLTRETLEAASKHLNEQFDQGLARLGSLGKPFQLFAMDLDFVVARFPLLIGLAVALALYCIASRRRELDATSALLFSETKEVTGRPEQPWREFMQTNGPAWTRGRAVAVALAGIAWVALAASQLARSDLFTREATELLGGTFLARGDIVRNAAFGAGAILVALIVQSRMKR